MSEAKYGVECNNGLASHVTCPDGRKLYCDNNAILVATELNRIASERDRLAEQLADLPRLRQIESGFALLADVAAKYGCKDGDAAVVEVLLDKVKLLREVTAQRDAAVEALIGVQGLAAYMGWNLGDLGVKIAATICATPTPAPTVNAELLAACRELYVDEETGEEVGLRDQNGTRVCPFCGSYPHLTGPFAGQPTKHSPLCERMRAAIANAEKSN